jgi:hypothetical protein
MQAIGSGYAPFLRRMTAERQLTIAPWRCGLPSTTPAIQAGILFGNRYDIPGFRWYEKERRQAISAKRPDHVYAMRTRVSQGRVGILRGGSCYVSMFDGDADLALFTLSTMSSQRFFESVRGIGLLLLFLLSPFRVLRLLWLTMENYLAGIGRRLVALIRPGIVNPFDMLSPLMHAVGDALFTEVQTFGVMLDIYRRAPAIYANYNGYDEAAHSCGPNHRAAFRTLRHIDRRIQQINRMRERYQQQKYDLYVISDHGNTPSASFRQRHGVSLGEYIVAHIGDGASMSIKEHEHSTTPSTEKTRYLLDEWENLENRCSPRVRRALAAARRYVGRRVFPDSKPDYDLTQQQDVVVATSGPLAHIYFNVAPRPLDLLEVILLYPQLLDHLLANPDIGALAGRAGQRTIVLGQQGGTLVTGKDGESVKGPHPLAPFGDADYGAAQLHQLAQFPHAGDLIVLGAMTSAGVGDERHVVSFEDQAATHGGMGGPQDQPFIAWPDGQTLEPEMLNDAQDLYHNFARRYALAD